MSWDVFLIQVLNGISFGMLLFLIASGFTLIYGTMGILNLAHGSLFMIGAYVGLTVAEHSGNFLLGVLAAGTAMGVVGLIMERWFLRYLYKQITEQVLLTLGFVYIIQNSTRWIWGSWAKMGAAPYFLATSIHIGEFSFPNYRFGLIVIGLAIAFGLWFFIEKTRVGAIIRAGMDDKEMTEGLGLNYGLVCSLVFMSGAFIAGVAGFLGAPVTGAQPLMAWDILLLAFAVIVVGGMGSTLGALLGAILIGIIDAFGKALFPDFAMFTIYLLVVVILLVRPSGIMRRA